MNVRSSAKFVREVLAELSDGAAVTISINGSLYDVAGISTECHDDERSPRVVLQLGAPYDYGVRREGA